MSEQNTGWSKLYPEGVIQQCFRTCYSLHLPNGGLLAKRFRYIVSRLLRKLWSVLWPAPRRRPDSVFVMFDMEYEVRIDFAEGYGGLQ